MHTHESHAQRAARSIRRTDEILRRLPASWPGPEIRQFAAWLRENHYAASVTVRYVVRAVEFISFARERGATCSQDLPDHRDSYVTYWISLHPHLARSEPRFICTKAIATGATDRLLSLITPDAWAARRKAAAPPPPFRSLGTAYFDFLLAVRGLSPESIQQREYALRSLESFLQRRRLTLEKLSPSQLDHFVRAEVKRTSTETAHVVVSGVRGFLGYLFDEGVLKRNIAKCLDWPRQYQLAKLPRSIPWRQALRALRASKRSPTASRRNLALMFVLITYGVRARDVAQIALDHIGWRAGILRIPDRKNGDTTDYPLGQVVGAALIDYIENERPQSRSRRLFLSAKPPFRPVTHGSVSTVAKVALNRAGIRVPRMGSHTIRHTVAQRLLDKDVSHREVANILGQRLTATTRHYARLDRKRLRSVAMAGGEPVL